MYSDITLYPRDAERADLFRSGVGGEGPGVRIVWDWLYQLSTTSNSSQLFLQQWPASPHAGGSVSSHNSGLHVPMQMRLPELQGQVLLVLGHGQAFLVLYHGSPHGNTLQGGNILQGKI